MSSEVKNLSFRLFIWTKDIFFWQSVKCRFLTKSGLVKIHEIWTRKTEFFTQFTLKQLPTHGGTKID